MTQDGLEICVAASGFRCLSQCGALIAMRERGFLPKIVTGVSGGAWAAYSAYSENYDNDHALLILKEFRDRIRVRRLRRFLPPYAGSALPEHVRRLGLTHCSAAPYIKSLGIRHFYIGYTRLPWFRFEREDVLRYDDQEQMLAMMWRSSALPFVTHFGPHYQGAADGALRRIAFTSGHPTRQRWLFISSPATVNPLDLKRWNFTHVFRIKSPLRSAFRATDAQLEESLRSGYEQGMRLSIEANQQRQSAS